MKTPDLKIIWTSWTQVKHTGYAVVWEQLGGRLWNYGVEVLDFCTEGWDLCVFLGYPKAFLLGRAAKRPDIVWHTQWETDTPPEFWASLLNRGGIVWTPSRFCADGLERIGVEVPIHVSGYGVDGDVFRYRRRRDDGQFVFMAMGRIFGGRKGTLKVIEAFLRLKGEKKLGDDAHLIVKMSKVPWKHITHENVRRDDITLINEKVPTEHLVGLMQSCDVFVYPTLGEGFGLEPLEAMATGACVLVTDWGGPQEYIQTECCFPIPVKGVAPYPLEPWEDRGCMADVDYEAMKATMLWCYENRDETRALGARSAEYVRERWSWDQAAERAADLLKGYAATL